MKITSAVNFIIYWLRARPAVNILFIVLYFLAILFLHDPLAQLSLKLEQTISLGTYNRLVEVIYVIFLVVLIGVVWKFIKKYSDNTRHKLSYLSLTILFVIIHSRFMFDSKIEVIHSFEFTFLVFLIFPLVNRFGAAVFFTLPFMLIDEWYQYTIQYPYLDYFDLNDIVMDTYGCGIAMALLMIIGVKGQQEIKPWWKRAEGISLISLFILVLVAVKICFIAPYASDSCSNTLLVINERYDTEPFLRFHIFHNTWFHVMKPLEALIVITIVHIFYFGLDSLRKHSA
ncbi:MAG: VanZ family protein [Bacteroidota bacterium]